MTRTPRRCSLDCFYFYLSIRAVCGVTFKRFLSRNLIVLSVRLREALGGIVYNGTLTGTAVRAANYACNRE